MLTDIKSHISIGGYPILIGVGPTRTVVALGARTALPRLFIRHTATEAPTVTECTPESVHSTRKDLTDEPEVTVNAQDRTPEFTVQPRNTDPRSHPCTVA